MKNLSRTMVTIGLIGLSTISYVATAQDSVKCEGKMGDVKMSLLDLEEFKKQNGVCWMSMEGQSIEGTQLAYSLAKPIEDYDGKLPDARGRFLRVLDRTGLIDIDGEKDRVVGSPQEDLTGPHKHPIRISKQEENFSSFRWGDPSEAKDSYKYSDWKRQYWRGKASGHTSNLTTNETRPKNIAIYAYVHVGE